MKKRFLSLVLVVAMLLCVLPAASAAETPTFSSYYLSLNKSIAINFKLSNYDGQNFDKVVFEKDGKVAQTISQLPAAGADGKYVFTFTKLSPAELGKTVVAKLYLKGENEPKATIEKSALQYCNAILAGSHTNNLKTLVVDLLNFGAAYQVYNGETTGLVNANLGNNAKLASVYAPAAVKVQNTDTTNWAGATLGLDDCVRIRFDVDAPSAEGLVLKVSVGSKTYEISEFAENTEDYDRTVYSAYFDKLNPAQMHEIVTAQVMKDGNAYTSAVKYSIESYAADPDDAAVELCKYMMKYGDAAAAYVASASSGVLLYNNFIALPTNPIDLKDGETVIWSTAVNSNGQLAIVNSDYNGRVPKEENNNKDYTAQKTMSFSVAKSSTATVSVEWDYVMTWDGGSKECSAAMNLQGINTTDSTKNGSILCVDAKNGKFRITDGGSETMTTYNNPPINITCTPGQLYKIKAVIDFTANRYDLYIDGGLVVSNRYIRRDTDYLSTAVLDIKENVQGTTATICFDNLIVKETNEAVGKAFYVNANSVASFTVDVNKAPGVVFEYEVMPVTPGKDDNAKVYIKADGTFTNETAASNQTAINIGFKYGTINFGGSPFDVAGNPKYDMTVPHKVKIVAKETGFDLYVDGVLIVENHKFMNKVASVDKYLKVNSGVDNAGSATYDYLKISVAE